MTIMVWVHLGYLAICIFVSVLVARALKVNGPIFMAGKTKANAPLLTAKTNLLVVGFYLLTLGLAGFALRFGGEANDTRTAIEILGTKIGGMVFAIGFMHFLMVAAFAATRKKLNSEPQYVVAKPGV